ncbi:hypothetical protein TWF506_007685 [Arthrobotrys conoides]|uniref:Uncharacterized protein n=1 Tax=Arthrobotrys conoides TaxID=74498 RepID=A0AAN8NYL8_9PEZI
MPSSSSLAVPIGPLSNPWTYVVDVRTLDRVSQTLETRVRLTKLEGEAIFTELTLVQQQIDEVLRDIEGMRSAFGRKEGEDDDDNRDKKEEDEEGVEEDEEWMKVAGGAFGELARMQTEVEEKVARMGKIMDGMDELGMELELWLRYQSTYRNYKPR